MEIGILKRGIGICLTVFLMGVFQARGQASLNVFSFFSPFCEDPTGFVEFFVFNSSSCGGPTSIDWDFGDGNTLSTTSTYVSHNYAAAGTYTVTATATWPCSTPFTWTRVINLEGPLQTFNTNGEFSQSDSVCFDGFSFLSSSLTLGGNTALIDSIVYDWGDGSGQSFTSWGQPLNASHAYTAVGVYNIEIISYSTTACYQDTLNRTLTVLDIPSPTFTSTSNCAGAPVSFTDLTSGITVVDWLWEFGDGGTSTLQNPTHTYPLSGNYTVSLTVQAAGGCAGTSQATTVITTGSNQVDFTAASGCPCSDLTFTPSGANVNYSWSFGDGSTSSANMPSHSYLEPGSYVVDVTATDASGCISRMHKNIDVCPGDLIYNESRSDENWQMYDDRDMDFSATPSNVAGSNNGLDNATFPAREAISTISDHNTGALLFYSNGEEVWDATLTTMQNGSGLKGNNSSSQGSLILPFPGDTNRYYLFVNSGSTIGGPANQMDTIWYNVIDMTLNGGLGGVVPGQKNILLTATDGSESTTGIARSQRIDCDNDSYWLIVSPEPYRLNTYEIDQSGINLVQSQLFGAIPGSGNGKYMETVFSPSGTRLAATGSADGILLYDFDISTGTLSNQQFIQPPSVTSYTELSSVEFSADNMMLYAAVNTSSSNTKYIAQYDVSTNNIKGSEFVQAAGNQLIGSLKRGEDDKIYFTRNFNGQLGVINDPNVAGAGCNLVVNGKGLSGAQSGNGLQNIVKLLTPNLDDMTPAFAADSASCLTFDFTNSSTLPNYPDACSFLANNDVISTRWEFGDGSVSTSLNPSHTYAAPGNYNVSLILTRPYTCEADTLEQMITVNACSVLPVELGDFTGETVSQGNMLYWNTISEINSSHFVLERSNGAAFEKLTEVDAQGNSQTTKYYDFLDVRPRVGMNYYRLTAYDLDGTISYTETIALEWKSGRIRVYPNPANDWITVETTSVGNKSLSIISSEGRIVKQLNTEEQKIKVPIHELESGVYHIRIESTDGTINKVFVKRS